MKKGISIWSFGDMRLEDAFALAKKAGFEGVEVALNLTGEMSLQCSDGEILSVGKAAKNAGIELYSVASGLYWDFPLTDDDKNIRAKGESIVKRQLEVASLLGCDGILVIPGTVCADFVDPTKVVDYETCYQRSLKALTSLKSYAEQLKVNICLENVWSKFLTSPLEMRDFIDKIGSDFVGSYLDVGNVLFNGYPEHWVKALGTRIKKVHLKDYRRAAGGLHGFVDLLAGDVDFDAVIKALGEVGYDGWLTAEMIPNYRTHNEALIYNTSTSMDKILGRN